MNAGQKIANKAMSYKGKSGGFVWDYWPGLGRGASWCVGFVLYVLYHCGLKRAIYKPSQVSAPFWLPTIEEWLHRNATHVKMADARPGDIVIFTWTGGGNNARKKGICSRDHIGFIRKKGNSTTCYTIEGNTSGGIVDTRTRALTNIFAIYRLDCCKGKGEASKAKAGKVTDKVETKTAAQRKAIDVSAWQGRIPVASFKTVRDAGYDTVILRCSYTEQHAFRMHEDKVFEHNIKTARAAKLNIGVYHYSQAITKAEARQEAEFVIKTCKRFKRYITEQVVFDWEFGVRLNASRAKALGKTGCGNIAKAFCEVIREHGYEPMVYANYSTLTNYLPASLRSRYKIWLAHYASKTPYKGYYLWQYSSKGKVPGLQGHIDVNVYAKKTTTKPAQTGKNGYSGAFPTDYVSTVHYTVKNAKRWQKFLNWYFGRTVVRVDGIYGARTACWTKRFQEDVFTDSTEWDGVAGTKTIAKAKTVKR